MKYLCLVYLSKEKWNACPDAVCFEAAKGLQMSGHLLAAEPLTPDGRAAVLNDAIGLVESARKSQKRQGVVESFLQEFSLGTREGLALMCLAEALLRTPDADTRDRLIADAKAVALEMVADGYRPRLPRQDLRVPGEAGLATIKLGIHLAHAGMGHADAGVRQQGLAQALQMAGVQRVVVVQEQQPAAGGSRQRPVGGFGARQWPAGLDQPPRHGPPVGHPVTANESQVHQPPTDGRHVRVPEREAQVHVPLVDRLVGVRKGLVHEVAVDHQLLACPGRDRDEAAVPDERPADVRFEGRIVEGPGGRCPRRSIHGRPGLSWRARRWLGFRGHGRIVR